MPNTIQTEIKLKPWDELTAIEKREAIAVRIGWKSWRVLTTDPIKEFPDWPNDDGLAFTEVWDKLCASDPDLFLSKSVQGIPHVGKFRFEKPGLQIAEAWVWESQTWADAICQVAYSILESPNV